MLVMDVSPPRRVRGRKHHLLPLSVSGAPVAEAAGYPKNARHVSKVLNQVPGLPWQRVLGSGGRISLSGEHGLEQRFLLEAEGVRFKGGHVDLGSFEYHFPRSRRKPSSERQ